MTEAHEHLVEDVDAVLQASLNTDFSLTSNGSAELISSSDARPSTPPPTHHFHYAHYSHQFEVPASPPPADPVSREDVEKWQAEQEVQLAAWREENARAREKAEEERKKWEQIREEEKKKGVVSSSVFAEEEAVWGPPNVLFPETLGRPLGYPGESSAGVSGKHAKGHAVDHDYVDALAQSVQSSTHKWEEIHSDAAMESSYPSMSFPSHSRTPSPSPGVHKDIRAYELRERHEHPTRFEDEKHQHHGTQTHEHSHSHSHSHPHEQTHKPALTSPTLAVFAASSTKSRLAALASTLAINLLLPFINGVMLGFGEIVARNLVVRLGWGGWSTPGKNKETKRPGGAATALGLSSSR